MAAAKDRIDWIDYSKGFCIILVVMMHSGLGVEKSLGEATWLRSVLEWGSPFRMPDFFLISGLLLSRRIDTPWRSYLDSKVVHFVYFYVLWMTIQFLLKGNPDYPGQGVTGLLTGYAMGFLQPYGTLWFIYLLPVFFVVTKALRHVSPLLVFFAAAMLESARLDTGILVLDNFASRYVYFFAGYWMAGTVFAFARNVGTRNSVTVLAALVLWGAANAVLVNHGMHRLPGLSLVLGFAGTGAVIAASVLAARAKMMGPLAYCGQNSIIIYLAFFLFMASCRVLLLKLLPWLDGGVISLLVTGAAVIGPVLLWWAVRNTRLSFLFHRPGWARLEAGGSHAKLNPATARSA